MVHIGDYPFKVNLEVLLSLLRRLVNSQESYFIIFVFNFTRQFERFGLTFWLSKHENLSACFLYKLLSTFHMMIHLQFLTRWILLCCFSLGR